MMYIFRILHCVTNIQITYVVYVLVYQSSNPNWYTSSRICKGYDLRNIYIYIYEPQIAYIAYDSYFSTILTLSLPTSHQPSLHPSPIAALPSPPQSSLPTPTCRLLPLFLCVYSYMCMCTYHPHVATAPPTRHLHRCLDMPKNKNKNQNNPRFRFL